MKYEVFCNYVEDVINWNMTVQNGQEELTLDKFKRQIGFTSSEAKETVAAHIADDDVELLDGVADVFVTMTYLNRIWRCIEANTQLDSNDIEVVQWRDCADFANVENIDRRIIIAGMAASMRVGLLAVDDVDITPEARAYIMREMMNCVCYMIQEAEAYFKIDMSDVLHAVSVSNWSKFQIESDTDPVAIEAECRWIENEYNVKNVAPVYCNGFVVYRDDHGKGKVRKPSTYKKPDFSKVLESII